RALSGGGIKALEHHSESEEALYAHTPGIKVVMPSGPRTAYGLLRASIREGDPVLFLEPKSSAPAFPEPFVPDELVELGKARIVKPGTDLTLVTFGAMLRTSVGAVERAEKDLHASIEGVDLSQIAPYD